SLRAICRIGHSYGYPLEGEADREFVAGVLDLANADDPAERQAECEAIFRGLDGDGPPPGVEGVEKAVADDLPLEALPFVGDVSSIFLDYAFVRRVDVAARRVFQERWLRDRGKVESIPPDPISHRRSSLEGVVNVAGELAYTGSYAVGFGVTFPAMLIGTGLTRLPGSAGAGFRDGAEAAARDAARSAESFRSGARDVLASAPAG
ncbi:MAG TPA: EcsC family protein, partial [Isosphaeraceae bacterium]|nr:EcsC family protein [Isosphaeraceae bacterium]